MKTQIFSILFVLGVLLSNVIFATESSFFQNLEKDVQTVNVYPNPVNEKGVLVFNMEEASLVKIEFYDLSGKKVKEMKEIYLNAGEQSIEFNASNLITGIYLCKIKTQNLAKVKRILVKR